MLQKLAMTRRFICHHGMLQPLRWLDVRFTVVVGQRCHFSTEKHNKFTMPQLTQGKSSHLEGHLTQQPWMKTWYCQVRRFGDVCAPRVAAQTDLGSVFTDPSEWHAYPADGDVSDEKQDDLRIQNGLKSSDKKPVRGRGRPGSIVKWTNLLTLQAGSFPSMAAAARELGVSNKIVAKSCRRGSQIGDYKIELVARPELDSEKGLQSSTQGTERKTWMVSNYGRLRRLHGGLTHGSLHNSGYRRVRILGEGFYVHRVVLLTFRGPPPSSSAWQVHHRDGDPSNNRVENLTYVTNAQNTKISYANNPQRGSASPAISQPVFCKNVRTSKIVLCPSVVAAATELGVSGWKVARSCRKGTRIRDYELEFAPPTAPEILEGEQWRPMVNPVTGLDVPGRQVSSHGRLKSAKGLITTGHRSKSGYVRAKIYGPSAQCVGIHRLVARAFLGPPPSPQRNEVNHKDLDRGNNRVENLEYVTTAENQQHYHASRGIAPASNSKAVLGRPHGTENEWLHYPSMRKAAEAHGVCVSGISRCAKGLIKHIRGYEFRVACSQEPADLPGEEWRPVDLEVLRRDKAERKGRSKETANGSKTSPWNAYPDMSGMVENNAFPPGVSVHVSLIL